MMNARTLLENAGAATTSDKSNENGRFITVKVEHPSKDSYALRETLLGHFANVSQVSYDRWDDTYSIQVTTKRPAITGRGVIHRRDEFGDVTYIKITR